MILTISASPFERGEHRSHRLGEGLADRSLDAVIIVTDGLVAVRLTISVTDESGRLARFIVVKETVVVAIVGVAIGFRPSAERRSPPATRPADRSCFDTVRRSSWLLLLFAERRVVVRDDELRGLVAIDRRNLAALDAACECGGAFDGGQFVRRRRRRR